MLFDTQSRSFAPVAFRVVCPYTDEDSLIAAESHRFSSTCVQFVGTSHKPNGVVLRFELALSNGIVLLYGEGRVVHYEHSTLTQPSLLTLRIVRLDEQSKTFLEKVLRYQKKQSITHAIESNTLCEVVDCEASPITLRSSSNESCEPNEILHESSLNFEHDIKSCMHEESPNQDKGFIENRDVSFVQNHSRRVESVDVLEPQARQLALMRLRTRSKI